ncbi:HAD family hydrolase [Sporomusa acidovorans]|uniref:5'-nucleotidase n=1 Tax=Sporomusa acidovorans (strain ATCC 49682 / DSM 3132 / Mol) TaxID=1123286 RepID=A0ABZ3J930_SPOA4|nr:HAD family hydrolase [Sporomusa acidovorans]OZC17528.1 5'-nucleotidase [Sporomusa acidovorans DSM 3132]SDF08612.1 phosphoglycolate phosphatase [Sporomusa acidovorans]
MGYQVILFDLDGTLTDPKVGITKSVQYALAKFAIHEPDLEKLVPFIGPPLVESFQEFYSLSREEAVAGVGYYREYFTQAGMFENAVYPGTREMLALLSGTGKKLLVATSKPTVYSQQIIEHFNLPQFFQLIVGSNLDGSRIHKDEIISYILTELNCMEKKDIVMVGDRKHDVIGAQKNSIDSIAVQYGYGTVKELQDAGPTYMAATVDELTELLRV